MTESGEIVSLELTFDDRLRLYSNITSRMGELGLNCATWDSLDLPGLRLGAGWPVETEPTLAELVVIARKLRTRLVINKIEIDVMDDDNGG